MSELNFCGCGQPETALKVIHEVMKLIFTWDFGKHQHFQTWWDKMVAAAGNEGSLYIILYELDRCFLTEHGGSVPGWLSSLGKEYLEKLNKLFT